jgi:hypothetical protein
MNARRKQRSSRLDSSSLIVLHFFFAAFFFAPYSVARGMSLMAQALCGQHPAPYTVGSTEKR